MTASVENSTSRGRARSRRALLAGALGGVGAWAAAALGRASAVRAANGDPVLVGGTYTATSVTKISTTATNDAAFWGEGDNGVGLHGSSYAGTAILGSSTLGPGVTGTTSSGIAVDGNADTGYGVIGGSGTGVGVQGSSLGSRPAILGWSQGNSTAVQGFSGSRPLVPPSAKPKT